MTESMLSYALVAIYFSCLVILSFFSGHRYIMLYHYLKNPPAAPPPDLPDAELPTVTVQLPMFNERFVVERLLASFAALDYPKDKFQIQVLDDSTDETADLARAGIEKLRAAGIDAEYVHRSDRTGYKAGALQNGLATAKGEFIAIFDADFVPEPDFLRRTMPRFDHPSIGMVQMRWEHINRRYSFLTQLQSIMLDGHFVIEHAARNFSGRFFNFNGTAGIWRREAIADAGGWQHDTLTEDLDLSYRAQLRGWKFVYLPAVVAPAELPVEMNAFKTQQHRWTKGSIQTALKLLPRVWASDFPFKVKVEATFHLANNFAYLFLLLVALLMLPVMMVRTKYAIEIPFWIDMALFMASIVSIGAFYGAAQRAAVPGDWRRQVRYLPFMMSLGIGLCVNNAKAVLEALFGVKSGFVRTPKFGVKSSGESWFRNPYVSKASVVALIETGLAVYYLYICGYCVWHSNYYTLPFMMLFLMGFGYVGLLSLASGLLKRPEAPPAPAV